MSLWSEFVVIQSLSCLTLCDPRDLSTLDFPVLHYLLELAQTHIHWLGDAVQPSHPLPPPFLPALSLSQHQVVKVLELQLQHQSSVLPKKDVLVQHPLVQGRLKGLHQHHSLQHGQSMSGIFFFNPDGTVGYRDLRNRDVFLSGNICLCTFTHLCRIP